MTIKLLNSSQTISKHAENTKWCGKWMSTYQNGLCSDPCTVGLRGGLLTVPNLNSDIMRCFSEVR